MKLACVLFQHPKTGEQKIIPVELTDEEIKKSGGVELYQHAYALRHAYRTVPDGFRHVPGPDGIRGFSVH